MHMKQMTRKERVQSVNSICPLSSLTLLNKEFLIPDDTYKIYVTEPILSP